jgi:putative intracellular protease/amidase
MRVQYLKGARMINYFIIYEECCFYEIVILSYFMKYAKQEMRFCSLNGKSIRCTEGFCVNADISIDEIDIDKASSIILTGGNINNVRSELLTQILTDAKSRNILIGAICAGVDILEESGILKDINSTHSTEFDVICDKNIVTARANAYVDFAIEVAKQQELFEDESDLQETIQFWKYHKRM